MLVAGHIVFQEQVQTWPSEEYIMCPSCSGHVVAVTIFQHSYHQRDGSDCYTMLRNVHLCINDECSWWRPFLELPPLRPDDDE